MKGALLFSAAAALVGSVLAGDGIHRRHAHDALHHRRQQDSTGTPSDGQCGCTTKVITYYGQPTPIAPESTTTIHSTSYTTVTVEVSPSPSSTEVLPTPIVTVYPTPGTYTIPETTIVVTHTTTVCGATSTAVPPGEHTYGGVTTVVETSTTVTCPYATVKPVGATSTSVIEMTTYVCPSAGTYTIAPSSTSVSLSTVLVYPTPATFTPGTYTQPAQTLTVVETSSTYVCPAPTVAPTSAAPTSAAPAPAPTSSKPAPKPSSNPLTPIVSTLGTGKTWGMTYTPYTSSGQCKNAAEVLADIALIKLKGFKAVRLYSAAKSDCNGLENVGNACKINGLKMVVGIFITNTGIEGARQTVTDIVNWGQWDLVDLFVVGNEAIFNGYCNAGSLAAFIKECKSTFASHGCSAPVTTTEPINIWQGQGSALCDAIDVLGANIHGYFNPNVEAKDCGKFVKGEMDALKSVCPGKRVVNLETGWPSAGKPNGKAVAGVQQQQEAIDSLVENVGPDSMLFSFANDLWKSPGELGIEQYFGCANLFSH